MSDPIACQHLSNRNEYLRTLVDHDLHQAGMQLQGT